MNSKQWRFRYLCHDENLDDCIDQSEFVNMLSVGFGEPGEAIIDAIAFAEDESVLTANSYDLLDQQCARIFILLDVNDDRILQPKEGKNWIHNYADPATVGETAGLRNKWFRNEVKPLILGESYVNGDPFYFRWENFLPVCRNTEKIPLKTDFQITDEELEDKAPPAYTPPAEYLLAPPLLAEMDGSESTFPDVYSRVAWYYNVLEPWFIWANTHEDGPCRNWVSYD